MLGNTQNKDNAKEENKKLNFWFWFCSGSALICAIFFVFAAISLLGMAFPGVFGGLWAVISNVSFIADMFSLILLNAFYVVVMPIEFIFFVREVKKAIKIHVTDENKENNQDEVEELKANDEDKNKNEMKQNKEKNENHLENEIHENKVSQEANENNNNKENKNNEVKERKLAEELKVKDEDKNKNEMKQNKEKNENHLENKIDEDKLNRDTNGNNNKGNKNNEVKERKPAEELKVNDEDKNKNEMKQNKEKNENHLENEIHENKINQDTNENNNKENKNNEVKERKPAKTVGEIADIFLADTLDLMPDGDARNGEYIIQEPKLLGDWHGMLEHRFSGLPLPMKYPPGVSYCDREGNPALVSITMQSEHFGHGKLPITIPSEHIKQRLNEIYSMRQKNDNEDKLKTQKREKQERQVRDELRKKKQVSPQMEDCNKDENKNM